MRWNVRKVLRQGAREMSARRAAAAKGHCAAQTRRAASGLAGERELSALQFFQPMGAHALSCPIVLLSCANKMRE
jgi:hypothetical protein